jgi:hypothetical protein
MKFDVLLSIIGLACLFVGFGLFLYGNKDISIFLTLIGVGVYLYRTKKKKESA